MERNEPTPEGTAIPSTRRAPRLLLLLPLAGALVALTWYAGSLRKPTAAAPRISRSLPASQGAPAPKAQNPASDASRPALDAYNQGDYAKAESTARQVIAKGGGTDSRPVPHPDPVTAKARWTLAFAAARRNKWVEARRGFAVLTKEAHGKPWTLRAPKTPRSEPPHTDATGAPIPAERAVDTTGQPLPTLEEEGAYQHAVLTMALSNSGKSAGQEESSGSEHPTAAAAEAEFVEFMRKYPDSPLVHGAIGRIGKLHGGNIPKDAEAVWKEAKATAQRRQKVRDTARSLCGPEVMAEVLRRAQGSGFRVRGSGVQESEGRGRGVSSGQGPVVGGQKSEMPGEGSGGNGSGVQEPVGASGSAAGVAGNGPAGMEIGRLAQEMGTNERGTSLAAIARAAEKRGLRAKGYRLTWKGLWKTARPGVYLVALLRPEHFVLIERVMTGGVRVWDPSGSGPDRPGEIDYLRERWERDWSGNVLVLEPGE